VSIRKKNPDKEKALSIINAAEADMDYTLSLQIQ